MAETTTDDVRDELGGLSTANFNSAVFESGIQVTVAESEIGLFWQAVRQNGFDADAARLGDALVARIEAEESGGLGDLFG